MILAGSRPACSLPRFGSPHFRTTGDPMPQSRSSSAACLALAAAVALGAAGAARSQSVTPADFAEVRAELARQAATIALQQGEIDQLRAERDTMLSAIRATGGGPSGTRLAALDPVPNAVTEAPPVAPVNPGAAGGPVGERPASVRQEVAAIPPGLGVLTPRGHFVIDPSIEYVRTSNNRLVFRGVEIVPGVQLGVIEASDAARDTGVATLAARYGLTDRLEVEARVPYVTRRDRITTLAQRDQTISRSTTLDGQDIGDIEFAARYQLNSGQSGWPIFVATSRVKPPTGRGPFDVNYDAQGVATNLATGSGFWGVEGGVTMLYPTDPAIIFGGLTYLHNVGRNIDRDIGAVHVGQVDPGDSIGASLGFGLSLNPQFSVSFGYSHNFIFPTHTELGGTKQTSQALQVGSLLMGWSFRLSDRLTLNNSFEFGVTSDAPDLRIVFRAPYRF
jgi:hypothetical protein